MWRTKNLKLTADQKSRGVIYSSQLIVLGNVGVDNSIIHEVLDSDPDKWQTIENLRDTSFFKSLARDFGWDVIHEVRK